MKASQLWPSKYVVAADLNGRDVTLAIKQLKLEEMGVPGQKEEKPVLFFEKATKGLVLNRTNGMIIAALYGDDVEGWSGKRVTLYPTTVRAFGKVSDVIRIREAVPPPPAKKPETAAAPVVAEEPDINDPEDYLDNDGNGDGNDDAVAQVANPFDKAQPYYETVLLHLEGRHLETVEWAAKIHERSQLPCKPITFEMLREMIKPYTNGHFIDVMSILCQCDISEDVRPGDNLADALIRFVPDVIPLADGRERPNKDHNPNLIETLRHLANVDVTFEKQPA